jgi:hypothetical protein
LGVRPIHFTQEQARETVGVSAEKLRHWRRTIPYLQRKAGKSARFTFADLLALAVTLEIVDRLGVGIGVVRTGIGELFDLLGRTDVTRMSQLVAVVSPRGARLCTVGEVPWSGRDNAVIVVPCWPLIERVTGHVLPLTPELQSTLPFPPHALRVPAR